MVDARPTRTVVIDDQAKARDARSDRSNQEHLRPKRQPGNVERYRPKDGLEGVGGQRGGFAGDAESLLTTWPAHALGKPHDLRLGEGVVA